ncbi:uncharacterized protein LOC111903859 [Lactuca sativa]|nr:uncharacterized protein LOC111903859 [Lactuca sativa]XP_052623192.1 uncharacterized protein LOC111903859 [Lactuca sativa]
MALEDFFTSIELKNGLTSPERVNDLITAMQKDQDFIVNNLDEATRQWSTVARTIAATEDHNCLNLFIDLNGLSFIDKWLKNDANNILFEESMVEFLRALEKLQIDNQKSLDSGIGKTMQNLVNHGNSLICEKAKVLCDKWKLNQDNDVENLETMPLIVNNEEATTMDKVPTNQELTPGDTNLLVKSETVNSKTESPLEQIASSADVDNSSRKMDVIGDKDEDMVDFQSTMSLKTPNQVESPKTCSNSESEREAENEENGSHLFELSMNKKTSDLELDYGIIDPLEVARQVANEVEREVDDSRERSCSTSEGPKTPESTVPEETPPVTRSKEPTKESETQTLVSKPDITMSQVSEVAQESEFNTGKGISGGFDLNQEVCSEEVDDMNPVSISSTVSVVSASRATAASELPITPLQFEGTLGWKGSASTSAFRRVPESEKSGPHNNSSKQQRSDCLDIDLNDNVPSGEESSVEAGPTRPERPQLDLNTIGDEAADVARSDWWQSPSVSSSSSSKQPSRNIDLNLTHQPQESVISIFGTKVEVKNKDFQNLPQPSGRFMKPTVDFNIAKTHYNNQLFYNGFPPGPAMFFYGSPGGSGGPVQYMVDSRGAPVGPQIMGGSSPPLPFMVNMAAGGGSGGAPPGPTLNNFDLNTGLSIVGGKRREPDGRWDFFPVNKHQQPPWR